MKHIKMVQTDLRMYVDFRSTHDWQKNNLIIMKCFESKWNPFSWRIK